MSAALLAVSLGPASQVASAQCADPRGNSYCTGGGLVTFPTPAPAPAKQQPCADPRGNSYCTGPVVFSTPVPVPQPAPQPKPQPQPQPIQPPQLQPQATASPRITLDTDSAPVGGTLTVSGTGFALSGSGTDLFLNLIPASTNQRTALGIEMLRNDPSVIRSADDGTFSVQVAVPNGQPGLQQICALPQKSGLGNYICAPFTVLDGGTPGTAGLAPFRDPSAPIDPLAIIGRYQCSKVGINTAPIQACDSGVNSTFEPLFVINADGSYSWGDEAGTWTSDGTTLSFSGGETATVFNRRMDVIAQDLDGNTDDFQYTRMGD
jgi:hypothetical protein